MDTERWLNTTQFFQIFFIPNPYPKLALSLTHDLLCVLSMDTWWNFGHEL